MVFIKRARPWKAPLGTMTQTRLVSHFVVSLFLLESLLTNPVCEKKQSSIFDQKVPIQHTKTQARSTNRLQDRQDVANDTCRASRVVTQSWKWEKKQWSSPCHNANNDNNNGCAPAPTTSSLVGAQVAYPQLRPEAWRGGHGIPIETCKHSDSQKHRPQKRVTSCRGYTEGSWELIRHDGPSGIKNHNNPWLVLFAIPAGCLRLGLSQAGVQLFTWDRLWTTRRPTCTWHAQLHSSFC